MKKQITRMLMVALLGLCTHTFAQPVINNNNMPAIGNSHTIKVVQDNPAISQGPAGPDLTWSFEDLTPTDEHTLHFITPSETPHATAFEAANYAMEYVPPIQIGTPKTQYHFFDNANDGLTELGRVYAASDSQTGNVLSFNDAVKWLNYEWTYQDQLQDSFESTYTSNETELKREGQTTVQADGYGSLNLPYGRFDNVLRLRITTTYSDQVVGTSVTFNYTEESFVWISPKYAMPLLMLSNENVEGSPSSVLTVIYLEDPTLADQLVGVKETVALTSNVQFTPNPTQDFIHIQYNLAIAADVQINVYNELGQLVATTKQDQHSAGRFNNTIDAQAFPAGLYVVELRAGNERVVEKILVQ